MVYSLCKGIFALGFRYEIDSLRFKGLTLKHFTYSYFRNTMSTDQHFSKVKETKHFASLLTGLKVNGLLIAYATRVLVVRQKFMCTCTCAPVSY